MKKTISFFSTILLIALLSASCSSMDGLLNKKEKKITLTVLTYGQDSFKSYKEHLEGIFPRITFEVYSTDALIFDPFHVPTYEERHQLIREIIKDKKVDLYFGFSPTDYIAEYPLVDLATLIERDQTQFNEIQQKIIETNTSSDGTLTSLFPTFDRKVLFVNRKLFQDNGVPEPVSPMSWEEFRQSAKQLKESSDHLFGYTFKNLNWNDTLRQAGEDLHDLQYINNDGVLLLDQPEWRDLAKQLLDDHRGQIMKKGTTLASGIYESIRNTGMHIGIATDIRFFIDVSATNETHAIMDIPIDPDNPITNPYYGNNALAIDAESSYTNEAWEIITYLMSQEAATFIASDTHAAFGLVTYPELEPLYTFNLTDFTGIEGISKLKKGETIEVKYQFSPEAKEIVTSTIESEFVDYINGNSDFDQMWVTIEDMVRDINSDESNFFSNK